MYLLLPYPGCLADILLSQTVLLRLNCVKSGRLHELAFFAGNPLGNYHGECHDMRASWGSWLALPFFLQTLLFTWLLYLLLLAGSPALDYTLAPFGGSLGCLGYPLERFARPCAAGSPLVAKTTLEGAHGVGHIVLDGLASD